MTSQKYYLKTPAFLTVCYLIAVAVLGCNNKDGRKHIDISKINAPIKSFRFDQALFACDTNQLEQDINNLGNKFPDFSNVYFNEITGFARGNKEEVFLKSIRHFLSYKDYRNLFDTVQKKFPDVKSIDKEINTLFQHIKYYFPNEKLGDVFYFISGLNSWSAITVDTALGIGLDMYLGKDYPFYPSVQIPMYEIRRCEPEYIPIDASKVIYENKFPIQLEGKNLLSLMIEKGKQLLFVEYTLPNVNEELIIGYTPEQLAWCKKNEAMIWNYFASQKLLYATDWQDILRYINDGPNSTGMPPESPGNIGSWIGWQIVKTYFDKQDHMSLPQLLEDKTDAQSFLRTSGYRPQ